MTGGADGWTWLRPRPLLVASGVLAVSSAILGLIGLAGFWHVALARWIPVPLLVALVVVACRRAAAGDGPAPAAARFWRQLGWAFAVLLAATISNAVDSQRGPVITQQNSPPTVVLYLVVILVMLWALLRLPAGGRSGGDWLRFGLDAGIVMTTAGVFAWQFSFRRLDDWQATTGTMVSVLGIVLLAFAGLLGFVKVAFTGRGPLDRISLRLLVLAVGIGAVGGAMAPLMVGYQYLNVAQWVIPATAFVVACAAERQRRAAGQPPPQPRVARRRRPFSLPPYVAVAATDALLLITTWADSAGTRVVAATAVGLTALVVVRQITAFYDNARLLRQVDASLAEVRAAQRRLAYSASHDRLTHLPNRALFEDRMSETLAAAAPPGALSVALVDLDDFKIINDRLGHSVGDQLLLAVGERLRACVRTGDTVARLGGDEFGLLLPGATAVESTDILERIAASLERPIQVGSYDLLVRASIGLSEGWPSATVTEVMRRADLAMYAAKERGKGRYARYDPELDARTEELAEMGAELRLGLDRHEFHLLYQPVVRLPDGAVVGAEALVRWQSPQRGLVRPDLFIPVAERTGLIVPLGRWVLRTACRQAVAWHRELRDAAPEKVSVNVSARQLREPGFAAEVAAVLAETGLEPYRLVVEVTETAVFDGGPALDALHAIHATGVGVALDDFGTGHSSLGLLRTCPVDILKVDKSFVDGITAPGQQAVIATALIHITDGLRLQAVAEGVETADQAERLFQLGYRFAQGYHFAKPLAPDEIGRLLAAAPVG